MAEQDRVEHLAGEYAAAKDDGRGTDAERIGKHLAALGADTRGRPLSDRALAGDPQATANRDLAAERRAAAQDQGEPPAGRTAPASRQQKT